MNDNGQNLTRKQLRAIPIIISARTISEGVKQAGISKTIFYEWMKDGLKQAERYVPEKIHSSILKEKNMKGELVVLKLSDFRRLIEK